MPGRVDTSWANKYIGVPYLGRGTGFHGSDCYGLVRLIFQGELNIDLKDFSMQYEDPMIIKKNGELISANKEVWHRLDQGQSSRPFDVVSFNIHGIEAHMGVVADANKGFFLHTLSKHDSAIARLDSITWEKRIVGVYRHDDLL